MRKTTVLKSWTQVNKSLTITSTTKQKERDSDPTTRRKFDFRS